mmetsp:Transcript_103262/g.189112  ORF Transcript_103262/g.189112 Transcript_103262/m.189112 type:complete len:214 (-) Transcript_103262:40-681(-)
MDFTGNTRPFGKCTSADSMTSSILTPMSLTTASGPVQRMPSFVASFTACISSSCMGSKAKLKAQSKIWPSICTPKSTFAKSVGRRYLGRSPGLTVSCAATSLREIPVGKAQPLRSGCFASKPTKELVPFSTSSHTSKVDMPGRTFCCTYCLTCRCTSAPSRKHCRRCNHASSSTSADSSFGGLPNRQGNAPDEAEAGLISKSSPAGIFAAVKS